MVAVTIVALGCWALLAILDWHKKEAIKKIVHDLRIQQLGIAAKRFQAIEVAYDAGVVPLDNVYIASRDWEETAYESATTKAERVDALQKHYDRIKTLHDKTEALAFTSSLGGEYDKICSLKYWELEAKIWLAEEDRK